MTPPLRDATSLLVAYAQTHRDPRNIRTHSVGVPLVVMALGALLSRPVVALPVGGGLWWLTPAMLLWLVTSMWYVSRGLLGLGLAVSLVNAALLTGLAQWLPAGSQDWLFASLGCLGAGCLLQRLGHYYEGRRPSPMSDLMSWLVSPMFVVAEWLFSLGVYKSLRKDIERLAGPRQLRDLAMPFPASHRRR